MLRIAHLLEAQLRAAMERALPELVTQAKLQELFGEGSQGGLDPQLAPASKPEFGDFQANGALPLAKPLGQPPPRIAEAVAAELQADGAFSELCLEPQIAGPGFINLTLRPERLSAEVKARLADPRLGVPTCRFNQYSGR
jgi:arginyl-tRNA synthetase